MSITQERATRTGVSGPGRNAQEELGRMVKELDLIAEVENADLRDRAMDDMWRRLTETPKNVWDMLDPNEKLDSIRTVPFNLRPDDINKRTLPSLDAEGSLPADAQEAADRYGEGPPAWDWVEMWDKPVGGFHRNPTPSRIHRSHIDLARKKGFTPKRIAPVLGADGPVCDMHSQTGICGKPTLDYTDLLAHQKAKHPAEIEGRERENIQRQQQIEADRWEQQSRQAAEQTAVLAAVAEKLTQAGSGGNDQNAALITALLEKLNAGATLAPIASAPTGGRKG